MPVIQRKGAQSSQGFGEFTQGAGVNPNQFIENLFSSWIYKGTGAAEIYSNGIALASNSAPWTTTTLTLSGGINYTYCNAVDSSGNYYIGGYVGSNGFIAKYNSLGVIQWQRKITQAFSIIYSIAVDSSGNVYAISGYGVYIYTFKYNSSGVLQWQRRFTYGSGNPSYGIGVAVDSSANVYVSGICDSGITGVVLKYNTSGVLQWQKFLTPTVSSYFQQLGGISLDSSGNVYAVFSTGSTIYGCLVKYNSSGVLQWQRQSASANIYFFNCATDSNSNVIVIGQSPTSNLMIEQYNSSGVLQWQRYITKTSAPGNNQAYGVAVDPNNNAYICGILGYTINGYIIKYNSTGTLQWQREISAPPMNSNNNSTYLLALSADSNNNLYFSGVISPNYQSAFITKIAQNGTTSSGTAYVSMASSNILTDSAGPTTDSAGTLTASSGTGTDSAGALTEAAASGISALYTQNAVTSQGGMVWIKSRSAAYNHNLFDTVQGPTKLLHSNTTDATTTDAFSLTSFSASGFSVDTGNTTGSEVNTSSQNFVSWSFKKQAKFFDIVTYTGTGANRTISHNLGSTPGCIIVKRTDTTSNWQVYHSGLTSAAYSVQLNLNNAQASAPTIWNSTAPTSSVFSVGTSTDVNASGGTYVAYLFASNAGSFGSDGSQNVITCGSFATNGSSQFTSVNLGYEPQWVLIKKINNVDLDPWYIIDNMRGWPLDALDPILSPNNNGSENISASFLNLSATGFGPPTISNALYPSSTYIYIAIRRGPMAAPTSGTSVFNPLSSSTSGAGNVQTTGFPVDMQMMNTAGDGAIVGLTVDRLRGVNTTTTINSVYTLKTTAATNQSGTPVTNSWNNTGFTYEDYLTAYTAPYRYWSFGRAPNFFDEVCYTGTGANTTQTHNLGVIPELMIIKERSASNNWQVYSSSLGNTQYLVLNTTAAAATGATRWNSTTPTSSVFSIGTDTTVNASTQTYAAYLFATCLGVSKVGSYTGTGATQTINCGFTGGARFVMIKRTDSTGSWYVWDTARGMVAGSDFYLLLNSNAAEVNANNVYTATTGFQIVSSLADINASGGTYIYLAIA
jgi:hypothetical protein